MKARREQKFRISNGFLRFFFRTAHRYCFKPGTTTFTKSWSSLLVWRMHYSRMITISSSEPWLKCNRLSENLSRSCSSSNLHRTDNFECLYWHLNTVQFSLCYKMEKMRNLQCITFCYTLTFFLSEQTFRDSSPLPF